MSSVIEGYNYDIFISYRQKDNKGDRWVSEFVEALKTELESTFKEEISVYFDINPHDGLLETHDVDESLKDKLKCLIFIPVISRTYCDPKSFAWQHEFVAFVEQAAADKFGLKVKLPHGNVATRVLPVKIHDLDRDDQELCENVLGGVPRGVDFIFKSAGVNRPLRMNEDNPRENLNHTYYRDQINKVANAIDEIITGLKKPLPENEAVKKESTGLPESIKAIRKSFVKPVTVKILALAAIIITGSIAGYFLLKKGDHQHGKLSIAFIPFQSPPNEYTLASDGNNFVEAVSGKLSRIKALEIIPRISTLQFREADLNMQKLRRQLRADYYIGGRVWRDEGKTKIFIEVSDSRNGNVLWQSDFNWSNEISYQVTSDVVSILTGKLKLVLDPDETKIVFSELTGNPDANMNYLSGNARTIDSRFYLSYDYDNDSLGFLSAIKSYDRAIALEPEFAEAYIGRSIASSWGFFLKQLDSSYISKCKADIEKAATLDPELPELKIATAFYYYQCDENLDSALHYFREAAEQNPFDYQPLFYMAMVYRRMGKWQSSHGLIAKVARYNPREALFLTNIGMTYDYLRLYDSAFIFHKKAIDLMPEWKSGYINIIESSLLGTGNTREAWRFVALALNKTGDSLIQERIKLHIFDKKYKDALRLAENSSPGKYYSEPARFIDLAILHSILKNPQKSHKNYDFAREVLEKEISADAGNCYLHGQLAIALAGLGSAGRAVEEAELAVKLSEKNALERADMLPNVAQVYTMIKDFGHALDAIEAALSGYTFLNPGILKSEPVWNSLFEVPEFKKILEKYSK